jgi:hypothetical protein
MNIVFSRSIRAVIFLSAMLLLSCATPEEKVRVTVPETKPPETAAAGFACEEITAKSTNSSGIEAMPFMRISFFDRMNSGLPEMVVGNKMGHVYLYRNTGDPANRPWERVPGYFADVKAGAFSSPILADLDGDGKPELVVGTGGFSSESGKILFFRNEGTEDNPAWRMMSETVLSVGKDAAVAVVDYNFDGKPGIIACNSEGKIFFFKNVSKGNNLRFIPDPSPPLRMNFGMYAVPAAKKTGDKVFLVVGNSMGKLQMLEIRKEGNGLKARQRNIGIRTKTFASPAFAGLFEKGRTDLVIADGDGLITYYENQHGDFSALRKREAVFSNRIFVGPVCAPNISCIGNKTFMVIGNMDGTLRLFEHSSSAPGLPWVEKAGHLGGIRVEGFSRGFLTEWEGKEMLVTGQGNGRIRAFVNTGGSKPVWKEQHGFFEGISIKEHSTPIIFDPDGNGRWLLISGAGDGRLHAFRIRETRRGMPVWERIDRVFDNIRADRFSSPSMVRDEKAVYLFVGQQDGRIKVFRAGAGKDIDYRNLSFREVGFLGDVRMNEHSSPTVLLDKGVFDVISGDYSGNLRHFRCKEN